MSKRLPSLESLRFVEACVRHGSFTRAAAELGVTPTAVSLRIRDLEAELGAELFHRSGPRIAATEAGAALAGRIGDALEQIRLAVEAFRGRDHALRVTCVPTFGMRWLAPRLARYHALPDAVPIALDVAAELRSPQDFDLAVRTGVGAWRGFQATTLFAVEATPMLSPALLAGKHLSSPAELASLPLLPYDDWPRWFAEAGVAPPALRLYADDYPTHELDAAAAMEGAGVALLSPILFAAQLHEGKLIQPFPHVLRDPAQHFLLLKDGEARPAVLRFRDWLLAEAGATANQAPAAPSIAGTPG
ncbi:MAG TPA: LysR substrate-binding domain-containing protein [Dongiaceae bacterium]|nr:LysR substrate-binding domain-containing protein [Dongiaceae bacterium]